MMVAVPITTYWSKKRGKPGARLLTVKSVDWGDARSWDRYPHAYCAIHGKR